MPIANLDALIDATTQNTSQFHGLTAAYVFLGFGVPTIAGYTTLINDNNASNFGAGASGPTFNDENIYINTMNALYQGNATAKANFDAIVNSGATMQDKLSAVYDSIIPAANQSDAGRAYFMSQAAFYEARAAELGIAGLNGAALVGAAALIKIAVDNDIPGLGDNINDLYAAVENGTAVIPEDGAAFTPIETADGTQFDGDDGDSSAGGSFVFTTGTDALVGGDQNDTFSGVVDSDANSGQTFTIVDSVDGKGGTDALKIAFDVSAGGPNMPAATITDIENFFLRNVDNTVLTVDASTLIGHEQIWNDRSTSGIVVNNLATGAAGGINGNGVMQASDSAFGYKTATDAVTILFDGGTKGGTATTTIANENANAFTLGLNGSATSVAIKSQGSANVVDNINLDLDGGGASVKNLSIDAATDFTVAGADLAGDGDANADTWISGFAAGAKIVVTGDGKVGLGTLENNVGEVDASGNKGGVTVVLGQAGDKFTGSSGNDTVTLAAGAAGPTAAVAGGDGTGDRLIVTNAAQVDTGAERGMISGFEILRDNAGAALDFDNFSGFTALEVGNGGNYTNLGAQTLTVIGDNTGNITFGRAGIAPAGNDQMTITLDNGVLKNANGVDTGNIETPNIDVLTINSIGKNITAANDANSTGILTGADLDKVIITGDTDLVLAGTGGADEVDASAFTGALTVTANNAATILGGSGANTLNGSIGDDVLTGGAAKDTITGGMGVDALTGGGAADTFVFRNYEGPNLTGTLTPAVTTPNTDQETVAITADGTDAGNEGIIINYTLNGVAGVISGQIDTLAGANVDVTDANALASFVAAQLNGVTGITASSAGTTANATADNNGSLTINSVQFTGGIDTANGVPSNGTDVAQVSTITVDVDPVVGETYSFTLTPAGAAAGIVISATAATTNPQDLVTALVTNANTAAGAVITAADVGGADTTAFTITDDNADDGGFAISNIVIGGGTPVYAGDTNVTVAGSTVTGFDKIADFNTGGSDVLRLNAADNVAGAAAAAPVAGVSVQIDANGKVVFAATDDTLAEKVTALAADDTNVANNEVVFFEHGGHTYVYGAGVDTTNANADFLIELTGVVDLAKMTESGATAGDFSIA